MKKAVVIFSGGMDSTTALYYMKDVCTSTEIEAITFDYGSKHNEREYESARKICELNKIKNTRIELSFINQLFRSDLLKSGGEIPEGHYEDPIMKKTVVPFRNGIMLSIAAGYAESVGARAIVLGNHFGDHAIYPDCRKTFIDPMSDAIFNGTYEHIKLISPFLYLNKSKIVEIGNNLKVPWEMTYSCYKGREKHCGKCATCNERIEAFKLANIEDPTEYDNE